MEKRNHYVVRFQINNDTSFLAFFFFWVFGLYLKKLTKNVSEVIDHCVLDPRTV